MIEAVQQGERTLRLRAGHAESVAEARRFAELASTQCDRDCREALMLAASELTDNVGKYGVQHADPRAGTLSIGIDRNVARIRMISAVRSTKDAQAAMNLITELGSARRSAAEIYGARLRDLFAKPGLRRAQLGLLRLAFEGGFRLTCSFEAPLLQIVGERPCRGT